MTGARGWQGWAFVAAALLLTACVSEAADPRIAAWDASECGDNEYGTAKMERHPALMGLSPEPLIAAWGKPATQEAFRVGEPVGTFYGDLGRRTPPSSDSGKPAQQLTWTKQGCNLSVFFLDRGQGWRAVEAFVWSVGADF